MNFYSSMMAKNVFVDQFTNVVILILTEWLMTNFVLD